MRGCGKLIGGLILLLLALIIARLPDTAHDAVLMLCFGVALVSVAFDEWFKA